MWSVGGPLVRVSAATKVFREESRFLGRERLHFSFLGCKKWHTGCHGRFVLEIQRDRIFADIAHLGAKLQLSP